MRGKSNTSFYHLFFKRELVPLSGRKLSNLLIITLMLFIAFTVIGFAEGSLRYLEQKMKDPFINWVNVIPRPHHGIPIQRVLEELNAQSIKDEYYLLNAVGYNRFQYNFYDYHDIRRYYWEGLLNEDRITGFSARTLDQEDPVMSEIFSARNFVRGFPYDRVEDIGLVVTEDMLEKLNYPVQTPYVWMDLLAYRASDLTEFRVPVAIPVRAVVKYLPGLAGFASTPYFHQQRGFAYSGNPFNPINDNRLVMSYYGSYERLKSLVGILDNVLKAQTSAPHIRSNMIWHERREDPGGQKYYLIFANFRPHEVSMDILDKFFLDIYNHPDITPFQQDLYRLYDYETRFRALRTTSTYDRISLNFSNLDKLREFSSMILDKYGLEVDMAQIESRENYNFVSRLTGIISVVLIGFSILSILLFVAYLLKRHLESIKRNIGTFKAFGLSNGFLVDIYVKIVLSMLAVSTVVALLFSALFGYSGGMRLILYLFGSRFEPGNYFSLLSYHMLFALVFLSVFSIWVLRKVSGRILYHTPGDLIYERE